MKLLIINSVSGIRSTGRICLKIAEEHIQEGDEVVIAYGRSIPSSDAFHFSKRICGKWQVSFNAFLSRMFDCDGFTSRIATKRFLKWATKFNPDMLWLHNLHGYYINIEELFRWVKSRPNMKVKWTLHDCWAFTGHCAYFTAKGCNRWETGCYDCPQKRSYPKSILFDRSMQNFKNKKRNFCDVKNMELITPSQWLADLTRSSFLKGYPVTVINNSIDSDIFYPRKSDYFSKIGIVNKKVILGVASVWDERKGLNDFIAISKKISTEYEIFLVGITKEQRKNLSSNIYSIERTDNADELAMIYSSANVFFNPTYEDNYPTVNLEAEACGTPVVTYDAGGAKETIALEKSKYITVGDIDLALKHIKNICGDQNENSAC